MAKGKMNITKITVPMGRFQYVHLDEPTKAPDTAGEPSYQVTLIYSGEDNVKPLQELIEALAIEEFGAAKYKQLVNQNKFKNPLKSNSLKVYFDEDGNERSMAGFEDGEGYHITFKTRNKDRLAIYDASRANIDESAVKAGYYGRVNAGFGAFDVGGGTGVTAYLNSIQVCKSGELFGSGSAATADDFEDYSESDAVLASDIGDEGGSTSF
jgi:hypothetical protein